MEGQLQHPSRNYYRTKHYLGSVEGRLKFEYHKQSSAYIQSILGTSKIDPIDPNIDPKLLNNSSFNENMRLGSLARWGSALVRRGSRVRIPPEAPNFRSTSNCYSSSRCHCNVREVSTMSL